MGWRPSGRRGVRPVLWEAMMSLDFVERKWWQEPQPALTGQEWEWCTRFDARDHAVADAAERQEVINGKAAARLWRDFRKRMGAAVGLERRALQFANERLGTHSFHWPDMVMALVQVAEIWADDPEIEALAVAVVRAKWFEDTREEVVAEIWEAGRKRTW
jgi:hypothetical protein